MRTTFIRVQGQVGLGAFGPKEEGHPSVGDQCPACGEPFRVGERTTLVPLGPGAELEERLKCEAGRHYNAVAVEVHLACATGRASP